VFVEAKKGVGLVWEPAVGGGKQEEEQCDRQEHRDCIIHVYCIATGGPVNNFVTTTRSIMEPMIRRVVSEIGK
jgi:hypothetical protein